MSKKFKKEFKRIIQQAPKIIPQVIQLGASIIQVYEEPYNPIAYLNFAENARTTIQSFKKNKPDPVIAALTTGLQNVCEYVAKQFDTVHSHILIARKEQIQLADGLNEHILVARIESKQFNEILRKELEQHTEGLHIHLKDISDEMRDMFAISLKLICKEFNQLAVYMQDARNENKSYHEVNLTYLKEVLATANDIHSGIRRLESDHQTMALSKLGERIRRARDFCDNRLTSTQTKIEKLAASLCDWIVTKGNNPSFSTLHMFTGVRYLQDKKANLPRILNDILNDVSPSTTMQFIGFLAYYAVYKLRINLLGEKNDPNLKETTAMVQEVFNPMHWSRAADANIQLIAAFPKILSKQPIKKILKAADNQKRFHTSLRNSQLFADLLDGYSKTLHEIKETVGGNLFQQGKQLKTDCDTRFGINTTPLFDLSGNIENTLNNWQETIPIRRDMVGENLPVEEKINQYNDQRAVPPVLVFAERLGCLEFYRQVWFSETVDAGPTSPHIKVKANLNVKLFAKFTPQDAPHHFQTDRYTTEAYGNPRTRDIKDLPPHWYGKSYQGSTLTAKQDDIQERAKTSIRAEFLRYRKNAIRSSLAHIGPQLERLDFYRNLIIHYAIAAGFKSDFIEVLKKDIWSSNNVNSYFESYDSATSNTALPHITLAPNYETTSASIIKKLNVNDPNDFQEGDCLSPVNTIASSLRVLEISRLQQALEAKLSSFAKSKDSKENPDSDELFALFNKLKSESKKLDETSPELFKAVQQMVEPLEQLFYGIISDATQIEDKASLKLIAEYIGSGEDEKTAIESKNTNKQSDPKLDLIETKNEDAKKTDTNQKYQNYSVHAQTVQYPSSLNASSSSSSFSMSNSQSSSSNSSASSAPMTLSSSSLAIKSDEKDEKKSSSFSADDKENSRNKLNVSPTSLKILTNTETLATSEGIINTLQKRFGNSVHLLNPELGSVNCIFDSNKDKALGAAVNYAKAINGFQTEDNTQASNGFIQQDGGILKKPIIGILNTSGVQAISSTDTQIVGGSHWITWVVLPKNYRTSAGNEIKNDRELIFVLDSLMPNRQSLPDVFQDILSKGYKHRFGAPTSERESKQSIRTHTLQAAFPNAEWVQLTDYQKQQIGCTDCGWWAVDNAIKIVETGSADSIVVASEQGKRRAFDLRQKYPDMDKINFQNASTVQPKNQQNKETKDDKTNDSKQKSSDSLSASSNFGLFSSSNSSNSSSNSSDSSNMSSSISSSVSTTQRLGFFSAASTSSSSSGSITTNLSQDDSDDYEMISKIDVQEPKMG